MNNFMNDNNLIIPNHVGVIVDGNGRWAQERGLSRSAGHKAGAENLKEVIRHAFNRGIKVLSIFVFSTENFKRSKEEVDYLMNLFVQMFKNEFLRLKKENVKIVFSGRENPLPSNVLETMKNIVEETKHNTEYILNICINYGGRAEIIDAAKKISEDVKNGLLTTEEINDETFNKYLYQNLPPIDFLIRTSGELRISNFMLWQLSYAELYFPKTYFPDFNSELFDQALVEYSKRDRRFGGIKYEN